MMASTSWLWMDDAIDIDNSFQLVNLSDNEECKFSLFINIVVHY